MAGAQPGPADQPARRRRAAHRGRGAGGRCEALLRHGVLHQRRRHRRLLPDADRRPPDQQRAGLARPAGRDRAGRAPRGPACDGSHRPELRAEGTGRGPSRVVHPRPRRQPVRGQRPLRDLPERYLLPQPHGRGRHRDTDPLSGGRHLEQRRQVRGVGHRHLLLRLLPGLVPCACRRGDPARGRLGEPRLADVQRMALPADRRLGEADAWRDPCGQSEGDLHLGGAADGVARDHPDRWLGHRLLAGRPGRADLRMPAAQYRALVAGHPGEVPRLARSRPAALDDGELLLSVVAAVGDPRGGEPGVDRAAVRERGVELAAHQRRLFAAVRPPLACADARGVRPAGALGRLLRRCALGRAGGGGVLPLHAGQLRPRQARCALFRSGARHLLRAAGSAHSVRHAVGQVPGCRHALPLPRARAA